MWPPSTWRPNALQLSRDALYLACQAIANTLTTMPEIEWVNFLVVDRPVGLDIANTPSDGRVFSHGGTGHRRGI